MPKRKSLLIALLASFSLLAIACACPLSGLLNQPAEDAPVMSDSGENLTEDIPAEEATEEPLITQTPTAAAVEIIQWAEAADASSQFGDAEFSTGQALGEPDAFDCNDNPNAWGPNFDSSTAWITLYYVEPVFATGITVHESYSSDAVSAVLLIDIEGNSVPVYQGVPSMPASCPFSIEIEVAPLAVPVHGVRIELDMDAMQAWWTQIDAVQLRGFPVPADSPYAQVQAVKPTASAETFSFNNRWRHYLPLYETMDPRYDIGDPYSIQWETVNSYGLLNEGEGSILSAETAEQERILNVISADTRKELTLFVPLETSAGTYFLQPYDAGAVMDHFSAALTIEFELYAAREGIVEIFESDEGTLTAKWLIFLVSTEDPARDAVVMAFFNHLPLQ